jgi:hypothetical protein
MPRFVILRHHMPSSRERRLHWDLMLEHQRRLRTWALHNEPQAGREIPATALADHRLEYLDYEGPVSQGRGSVTRWDCGSYSIAAWDEDQVELELCGTRITGSVHLWRTAPDQRWIFRWAGIETP